MAMSLHTDLSTHYSNNAMTLAWAAQDRSLTRGSVLDHDSVSREDSILDYSVPGNRLCERPGYIEIVPKTPAEVLGERVLRPLLDTTYDWSIYTLEVLKIGFYRFDNVFSRVLSFLPGVQAETNENLLHECLAGPVGMLVQTMPIATGNNNAELVDALDRTAYTYVRMCEEEYKYRKMQAQYKDEKATYDQQVMKLETELVKCNKANQAKQTRGCYVQKTECEPELFQVDITQYVNGKPKDTKRESIVSKGHLSWEIFIDNAYWPDTRYAKGSYNYHDTKQEPNTETRKSILKGDH